MEHYIARLIKPVILSLICFVAIYYLTQNVGTALVISLIPLLLGWLGIMESFGYSLAAFSFIAAVIWAAMPMGAKSVLRENADRAIAQVKAEINRPEPNQTDTTLK